MELIWKTEDKPISWLKSYDKNPRKITKKQLEQLKKSIDKFNFTNPVLVNLDGTIIAGHQRITAMKSLGREEELIPCRVPNRLLDEKEYKELNIRDNKNVGDWDFEILSENFEIEDLKEWGFDEDELLKSFELEPAITEGDDELAETAKNITVTGDLYELGQHRLLCGDSTILSDIEKLVDEQQIDLLLTDPPYNVNYEGKTKESLKIENDQQDNESFQQFLKDAFSNVNTVMKEGAVFYIWHADSEGYNFRLATVFTGWKIRQCLIWNKNSMVMGRQDYQWKHEPCLYGWKDGAAHYWGNDRCQTTVLDFQRPSRSEDHPTMKPVELFAYQITNSARPGAKIIDPFLRSGTTLIACEKTGRFCYGLEIDPHYCDVIVKRYVDFCKKNNRSYSVKRNGQDCHDFS